MKIAYYTEGLVYGESITDIFTNMPKSTDIKLAISTNGWLELIRDADTATHIVYQGYHGNGPIQRERMNELSNRFPNAILTQYQTMSIGANHLNPRIAYVHGDKPNFADLDGRLF